MRLTDNVDDWNKLRVGSSDRIESGQFSHSKGGYQGTDTIDSSITIRRVS